MYLELEVYRNEFIGNYDWGCSKSSIFVMGNSSYMILYHDCVVSENYLPFQLNVVDQSFLSKFL